MLLTVQESTARLGITRAALYAAMAEGQLKYVEKYGKRLIEERVLTAYTPRAYRGQRRRLSAHAGSASAVASCDR